MCWTAGGFSPRPRTTEPKRNHCGSLGEEGFKIYYFRAKLRLPSSLRDTEGRRRAVPSGRRVDREQLSGAAGLPMDVMSLESSAGLGLGWEPKNCEELEPHFPARGGGGWVCFSTQHCAGLLRDNCAFKPSPTHQLGLASFVPALPRPGWQRSFNSEPGSSPVSPVMPHRGPRS